MVPGARASGRCPRAKKQGVSMAMRESDPLRILGERESRFHGEGADGVTPSAQDTSTGHVGLAQRCHPHCREERRKLPVTRHPDGATCVGFAVSSASSGAGGGCTRVPHQASSGSGPGKRGNICGSRWTTWRTGSTRSGIGPHGSVGSPSPRGRGHCAPEGFQPWRTRSCRRR